MANPNQNTRQQAPSPSPRAPEPEYTHVLVRSRRSPGFNRGGFRHEPTYRALSFDEIKARAAQLSVGRESPVDPRVLLEAILKEQMLDARLIEADEAVQYTAQRAALVGGDVTMEQLHDAYIAQSERIKELEARLDQLIGDRPPKNVEDAPGMPATRVTPR